MSKKKLLLPLLSIAAFGAVGITSTLALFTSTAKTDVDVSAGKVNLETDVKLTKVISRYEDDVFYSDPHMTDTHGTWENLGTVDVNGGNVALSNITPMDLVSVKLDIKNNSTVKTKYQIEVKGIGEDQNTRS